MSDKVSDKPRGWADCFEAYERFLLGGRLHLDPNPIEYDRRKQNKVMKALVDAGYVSESGGCYEATSKAWDETEARMPDLFQMWQDGRSLWNSQADKPLPLARYDLLLWDGKKGVLTDAAVRWYVVHNNVTHYRRPHDERDDYVYGPMTLTDAINKQKELAQTSRGGRDYGLCLDTEAVAQKIERTLAEEQFDTLYRRNLPWGLAKLGVIQKPEAETLSATDTPGRLLGGGSRTNLGRDPEKWGDVLAENAEECRRAIQRAEDQLAILRAVGEGVEAMGGWDVFRQRMAEELRAKLAKPNGDQGDE